MNRINIFRNKSSKSAILGSLLLGSFAFSHLQASDSDDSGDNKYLLHQAVETSDVERVRQLLDEDYDPNAANSCGNTPLHLANTPAKINLLCEKGANINARNTVGDTPLHSALYRAASNPGNQEYIECIKALLANGANPIIVNKIGVTSVLIAQNVVSGAAINAGDDTPVVVDDGAQAAFGGILAQLKAVIDPLHYAVMTNNELVVGQLLDEKPNPNLIDRFGNAPLHYAKTPEMVNLLCEKGANVNARNEDGDTPLHVAIYWVFVWPDEMLKCIKALLENGADLDIANKRGYTPKTITNEAVNEGRIYNGQSEVVKIDFKFKGYEAVENLFYDHPLHEAVENDNLEKVCQLLAKGCNPNLTGKRRNAPLHYAKTPEMVNLLCERGANVNLRNIYGDTPLHAAVFAVAERQGKMLKCIEALLENGADLDMKNKAGYTPRTVTDAAVRKGRSAYESVQGLFNSPSLYEAVENDNLEKVRQLLAKGCNPNLKDEKRNVSLHYAKTPEMVNLLCEKGANVNARNKDGDTPLHIAIYRAARYPDDPKCVECIKALLAKDANPSIANKRGDTSVLMTRKVVGGGVFFDCVYHPVKFGARAVLSGILEQLKAVINPLHYAVMTGDEQEVKRLLAGEADPNLIDALENTPLHYAADPGIINALCEAGANVDARNNAGNTPLHIAIYRAARHPDDRKCIERIETLLAKNANPSIANERGDTSVLIAQDLLDGAVIIYEGNGISVSTSYSARKAFGEILKLLKSAVNPLHYAVITGDALEVWRLLGEGADPNLTDFRGNAPLHYAKNSRIVNQLCEKGANVNLQNKYGDTPLHAALYRAAMDPYGEDTKCIEILLEENANPSIANKIGNTPVLVAQKVIGIGEAIIKVVGAIIYTGNGTPISVNYEARAAFGGILEQLKAVINPLRYAVMTGGEQEVRRLLAEEADPNLTDFRGNALLHYARTPGMVNLLCEKGANVNLQNIYGDTPLHAALYRAARHPDGKCIEYIKALLKKNANPTIANKKDNTSISIAQKTVDAVTIYKGGGSSVDVSFQAKAIFREILELFFSPTSNESGTSSVPSAAAFSSRASFQTPTRNESGISSARSAAAFSSRASFQTPTKNESGISSVPSAATFSNRVSFQTPTKNESGISSVPSAATFSNRVSSQTPARKKSGTSSVTRTAAASDRPAVSWLHNRSANSRGIGKPGTLSRDTTTQKALPKGKQQSAKSMGRSVRTLRIKPLAAGARGKPAPVQRTRRAALVQKRAVPTVSTVNHSGDYDL